MAHWRGHHNSSGNMYSQNRGSLFGNNGQQRGYSAAQTAEQTQQMWQQRNDEQIEILAGKVRELNSLSKGIGEEISQQNSFLDRMTKEFSGAQDLMNGTLNNLGKMISSGGSKHMAYLVLFVVLLFFFLYFLLSMKT